MTTYDVVNPATEQVVRTVNWRPRRRRTPRSRGRRGARRWRAVAPADRARLLRRFADAVDADLEDLARLEVGNSGHTIGNARWEAGNVRDVLTTTRRRRSGCSASRFRSPAASTSPSTSRSAWSA